MDGFLAEPSLTPRQVLDAAFVMSHFHDEQTCRMLAEAADYVSRVLTRPDPTLGRSGAICPFVGSALLDDMITLSVLPAREADTAMLHQAAVAVMSGFRPMDGRASRSEALRAVIILLPHLDPADAADMIETVQKALKPDMVARGLMIGEFYPGCTAPGLNNPDFRPADTSIAFLAIRRMTAGDLPFLINDVAFMDSYLALFGDDGRRRLQKLQTVSLAFSGAAALQVGVVAQSALPASIGQGSIHAR